MGTLIKSDTVRAWLYVVNGLVAFVVAVLIATGTLSKDMVFNVVALTVELAVLFVSALARLNVPKAQ